MPSRTVRQILLFPAAALYQIAEDVEAYPEFVPLCESVELCGPPAPQGARRHVKLTVAYPKLRWRESFLSEVTSNADELTIRAVAIDGPAIRHLDCLWRFTALAAENTADPDAQRTEVTLMLDYALSRPMLQIALSKTLSYGLQKFIDAFENRARQLLHPENP